MTSIIGLKIVQKTIKAKKNISLNKVEQDLVASNEITQPNKFLVECVFGCSPMKLKLMAHILSTVDLK